MLRATLLPVFRHFLKKKTYYFLQIFSLAIGLTAIGFTALYVEHEFSYDNWHPEKERVYRISYENNSGWFAPLAKSYSDQVFNGGVAGIDKVVRVRRWPSQYIHTNNEKFYEQKVLFTDPCSRFFQFFDFRFSEGSREQSLQQSHSAVISESLSKKLFKGGSAVGETIRLDTLALTITGVFEDLPSNTHLDFQMLVTNQAAMDQASGHFTYARLQRNQGAGTVEKSILQLPIKSESFFAPKSIRLIKLADLHFEGKLTYELKPAGNKTYIWILCSIGFIILIIAVTNFINLSVALFTHRSKEIAVRKSIGASVTKLSHQFFFESISFVTIALLLSLALVFISSPWFGDQLHLQLQSPFGSWTFILLMTGLTVVIALLTAIYPTLVMPRIRILDLFKNTGIASQAGLSLRSALIIIQFTILFFVCSSMWLISNQLNYIQNKDLGFEEDGVIKIKRAWNIDSLKYSILKAELLKSPPILAVSEGFTPGDEDYGFSFAGENSSEVHDGLISLSTDFDYLKALAIKPVEGVIVDPNTDRWPKKIRVINETLAKQLGYQEPIGKTIIFRPGTDREAKITIDAIVKDFHFNSLHHSVPPMMITLTERSKYIEENIIVRTKSNDLRETIAFIQGKVNEIAPDVPVTVGFLNEDLEKLYQQEQRLGTAAKILVVISLLLSFTGLIALCSYLIDFRMKEVAIRKVFGAPDWKIVQLFLNVFVRVTVIGFVCGSTIAYFAMSSWINDFAYRTEINPGVFAITLIIILILTVLVTVLQSMKAVRMAPVKVLKDE